MHTHAAGLIEREFSEIKANKFMRPKLTQANLNIYASNNDGEWRFGYL